MAFDSVSQVLNGICAFGNAGFGELHQEFIYTSFITDKLTEAVVKHYESLTGYD